MDLAVRHWIAMRGIFAPTRVACRCVASLDAMVTVASAYLREKYGEMSPAEVPRACQDHWAPILARMHWVNTIKQ